VYVRRCPTFPPEEGSIIGADRLSFRVRNGTGRFPVAVAAVTLFKFVLVAGVVPATDLLDKSVADWMWLRCVFVSFRPVSASSLHPLLSFQV
jgi:hypothetical protein